MEATRYSIEVIFLLFVLPDVDPNLLLDSEAECLFDS